MGDNIWKQKSLTPTILSESDDSYSTVRDLLEAINKNDILNIAVTGPYGSGKSSVLRTFQKKAEGNFTILDISLATLDADESIVAKNHAEKQNVIGKDEKGHEGLIEHKEYIREQKEMLNRKIEYSILQQLIYRETLEKLPYSRLKKIRHLSSHTIRVISAYIVGFILSVALAFKWSFLQKSFWFETLNISNRTQVAISIFASIFLLVIVYEIVKYIVKNFGGVRFQKFSVGGNEINVNDDGSIFNRYLEEIIYFFQCTKYDVIIIEDLDRFNTTDIFLKLRELNHLINKSKIVNRKIRFIYAVKDDMFKDASRSKFFDYITTVIPVITTSNSKDKLREALAELGHEGEVSNDSIRDIAFHIDDMRLLYNIANEYHQYSVRLNSDKEHALDAAMMLAMIAVKNYHPHDFSLLHKREGKIYNAISKDAKRLYVKEAIEQKITQREQIYKKKLEAFDRTSHLSAAELRLVYLMRILAHISQNVANVVIDGKNKTILQIANCEEDFNTIIKEGKISYQYLYYSSHYSDSYSFNFSNIEKEVNSEHTFEERMKCLSEGREQLLENLRSIEKEKTRVHTFTIKELLMKFNLYEDEYFRSLELSPMEEDFIRSGLVTEDYNDYISYFYPVMMSLSDHQLCLDMRLDRNPSYDSRIDDCEILLTELPDSAFQYKSVLNIQLLDFLAQHHVVYKRKFDLVIDLLLSKHPTDFLVTYSIEGKYNDCVWNSMMEANSDTLWINSGSGTADENIVLYRQWILHCQKKHVTKPQIIWINNHYDEIAICYSQLTKGMQEYFTSNFLYNELTKTSPDMLSAVVDAQCYFVNEHNMPYVVEQLDASDDISKLTEIEEKEISIKLDLIKPTWSNIDNYFTSKERIVDDILFSFISSRITDIIKCNDDKIYAPLFQSLMEYSNWKDDVYACLCAFNPFTISVTESIRKLTDTKLTLLVDSGAIEETIDNFKMLASVSAPATTAFLKRNMSMFNDCIDSIQFDASLAHAILSNPSFNQVHYEYVIQSLDSAVMSLTNALADEICTKLSLRYAKCDLDLLCQAVALSSNKVKAVMTAARAIESLKDENVTTELLSRLGGKYARLTEFHISETFVDTPSNSFLAKILQANGYISSYSTKEGKLKVNTKKSR